MLGELSPSLSFFFQSQFSCVGPSSHTHTLEWKNCGNSQGKPCRGNLFNKKKIWKFQRAFSPRTRSLCVCTPKQQRLLFKGSLEMAPKKNAREITRISKFFVGFYSAATQEQIFCCWWCPHSMYAH